MLERVADNALRFSSQGTAFQGHRALHARSAAFLIRWTSGLDAELTIAGGGQVEHVACQGRGRIQATALLRLMAFGAGPDDVITITAAGPDASEAIDGAMQALREEPPPADLEKMREWDERMREEVPEDSELDDELRWWIDRTTGDNPDAVEEIHERVNELIELQEETV